MKIINPKESDKILISQIGEIENSDDAIQKFFNFYKEFKIKKEIEYQEEDMMLFQYGIYQDINENNFEFNFNLTRQFEIENEDEFLQLGLTLFYDNKEIVDLESFSSWSTDSPDLDEWEKSIKRTEGYRKSKNFKPKRIEINLDLT